MIKLKNLVRVFDMKMNMLNKINIADDEIQTTLDSNIEISSNSTIADIRQIEIKILKDTALMIEYNSDAKIDFKINVMKNINFNIYIVKTDGKYKVSYKYLIDQNSNVNIYKIYDAKEVKEMDIIYLNGQEAKVNYLLKTISTDKEKYDIMVYHNAPNTESHIINNGVNIKDGSLKFNVSSFVPKNNIDCVLAQSNRIINLTNHKCEIRPNLFIDENDVAASHSAHIGKCNENEIFYLMSRGITAKEAENLIIKGFLLKGLTLFKEEMEKNINKYWR